MAFHPLSLSPALLGYTFPLGWNSRGVTHRPLLQTAAATQDIPHKMYIVERGIVGCKGRVTVRGKVIGADLMLTHFPSDYVARALTYTDLFSLKRGDIKFISSK